jgi:hypothetical protein
MSTTEGTTMTRFCGYDWTSAPRTCAALAAPAKIGHTSWATDGLSYSEEYWVCPDGSAEVRHYGEGSPPTEVLPPGTWEVRRDWPAFACRSGEYVESVTPAARES